MGKTNKPEKPSKLEKAFQVYDVDTGELIFQTTYRDRSDNGKDWCIMYQLTAYLLATDKELKFSDVRTYLYIVANADFQAKFITTKADMAAKIGISRQQLDSSIKILKKKDLIREGKLHGTATFFVNPYYTTRGRDKGKLLKAYEEVPKEVVKELDERAQAEELAQTF